tara:strand:- start:242 stop:1351 length:1110 start_codon:yes stop_codon:yes gene_type:complete
MIRSALVLIFSSLIAFSNDMESYLSLSGNNRSEIQKALDQVHKDNRKGLKWLISNMPLKDLQTLTSDFLLDNTNLAYQSWIDSPWHQKIPESIFFDNILPYANLNERREKWREDFRILFLPLIEGVNTPSEAAVILNKNIFSKLNVIYSTKRPKADQSPGESIKAGMASCTGLSILLIDACRSVGIPARFVGTSMWYNNSGNHSWVEIWDNGWHFTGAAEPVDNLLNVGWFTNNASKAIAGDQKYGIFAVTWNKTNHFFPMDWLPDIKTYNGIDITQKYNLFYNESNLDLIPIAFRVFDKYGQRKEEEIRVLGPNNYCFIGKSKGETNDLNDHFIIMLPRGKVFTANFKEESKQFEVLNETIIDFKLDH